MPSRILRRYLFCLVIFLFFMLVTSMAFSSYAFATPGKVILDNSTGGDCTLFGIWDNSSKTCTLTTDLVIDNGVSTVSDGVTFYGSGVSIATDGITLNGNGHQIIGCGYNNGCEAGIVITGNNGITIQGVKVSGFSYGVFLRGAPSYDTVFNNNFENVWTGIWVEQGSTHNSYVNNKFDLALYHTALQIDRGDFNNFSGNSVTEGGNIIVIGGSNNTISGNNGGISVTGSYNSILNNSANNNRITLGSFSNSNDISGNRAWGITLWDSSNNNTIAGNVFSNGDPSNNVGIQLFSSGHNSITGNTIDGHAWGVTLGNSDYNLVTGNTISNNLWGLEVDESSFNAFYQNSFINNNRSARVWPDNYGNVFNQDASSGGGNYWSDFSSSDSNGDGYYDQPYIFSGGQDNYPSENSNQELAERYKPQLFVKADDYVPVLTDIMTDIPGTYLVDNNFRLWEMYGPSITGTLGNYNRANYPDRDFFIDEPFPVNDADEHKRTYNDFRDKNRYPATMYAKVFHNVIDQNVNPIDQEPRTVIQYWFFYYFNDAGNDFGMTHHEGDWEMVQVNLDANLQPLSTVYSQHGDGEEKVWDSVQKAGDHPIVFVAGGTHANFYDPGSHYKFFWDNAGITPIIEEPDLRLLSSDLNWLNYDGRWGEAAEGDQDAPKGPMFNALQQWNNPLTWWGGHRASGSGNDVSCKAYTSDSSDPPISVNLYDSYGRRTGKDASGTVYEEIPNSEYITWPDGTGTAIAHQTDIGAGYTIEVDSQSPVPFMLSLNLPQYSFSLIDKLTYNINVTGPMKGKINIASTGVPQDFTMYLDTDADGVFDDGTVIPANNPQTGVDFASPAQINDLSVVSTDNGKVTLSWTAVGDDGGVGQVGEYDLRYSKTAIVDENSWADARPVSGEPQPGIAGTTQSFSIDGLEGGTYYFAVKARDEVGLEAPLSNGVSANIPMLSSIPGSPSWQVSDSSIDLSIPYTGDENANGAAYVEYKSSSDEIWSVYGTVAHPQANVTITSLNSITYDVRVTYLDPDGIKGSNSQLFLGISFPDTSLPLVTNIEPSGTVYGEDVTITADLSDPEPSSGIDPYSASVFIDGNIVDSCVVSTLHISCPVNGLAYGSHSISGSIFDNAGNEGIISGSFSVGDNVAPNVYYDGPYYINTSTFTFSAQIIEPDPSSGIDANSASLSLDGNTFIPCEVSGDRVNCTVMGLAPGYNEDSLIYLSDNAGNTGYASLMFEVDLVRLIGSDSAGGDCSMIDGIWDNQTRSCTLTRDLTEGERIEIRNDNVTVDGAGYTLAGGGSSGISVLGANDVTVKNLFINNYWSSGINIESATNVTLLDNQLSQNGYFGVSISNSIAVSMERNAISGSRYNFHLDGSEDVHFNNDIGDSNTVNGKPIYYIRNAVNQTIDASSNAGVIYCISCDGLTVRDVTVSDNVIGIYLRSTSNSRVENVTANNNWRGVYLRSSNANTVINSNLSNNGWGNGVALYYSNGNTITGNTANQNTGGEGIYLIESDNNLLSGNTTNENFWAGIWLSNGSSMNTLTGNTSQNNLQGIYIYIADHNTIYNNNLIGNLASISVFRDYSTVTTPQGTHMEYVELFNTFSMPVPTGGNYWSNYSTPEQGCYDLNVDGFCDAAYIFTGGRDDLPRVNPL